MRDGMKKIRIYKGFVIAIGKAVNGHYDLCHYIFTKDEWANGSGLRYPEWETETIQEAINWIG